MIREEHQRFAGEFLVKRGPFPSFESARDTLLHFEWRFVFRDAGWKRMRPPRWDVMVASRSLSKHPSLQHLTKAKIANALLDGPHRSTSLDDDGEIPEQEYYELWERLDFRCVSCSQRLTWDDVAWNALEPLDIQACWRCSREVTGRNTMYRSIRAAGADPKDVLEALRRPLIARRRVLAKPDRRRVSDKIIARAVREIGLIP